MVLKHSLFVTLDTRNKLLKNKRLEFYHSFALKDGPDCRLFLSSVCVY